MKIESLEQLQALVKVCRKNGIEAIEVDGIKLNLGDAPKRARKTSEVTSDRIDTEELTEEQLMFWSAQTVTGEHG